MRKKRRTTARRGRREFLKALPLAGAAFKWTADKLGGAVVGALLGRFLARTGEPTMAKRDTYIELEPARTPWTGMNFIEVYGRRDARPLNSLTPPAG